MNLSPAAWARILPFLLFLGLLALRGALADLGWLDARWIYALNLLLVGGLLAWSWRGFGELHRQNRPQGHEALWSVLVGLLVFVAWIQLDAPWMQIGEPTAAFVPVQADGQLDWALITVRWLGAVALVPVMEELFWRSFVMRWLEHPQFEAVPPQRVTLKPIVLSTFAFMLVHPLWLAAIVAGAAYAALYVRTGRLWNAVIAHAVTNGALGVWVVATGNWQFW
jgi:uncharacterized protein